MQIYYKKTQTNNKQTPLYTVYICTSKMKICMGKLHSKIRNRRTINGERSLFIVGKHVSFQFLKAGWLLKRKSRHTLMSLNHNLSEVPGKWTKILHYNSNKRHIKYSSKLRPKCLKTGCSQSACVTHLYLITTVLLSFTSCEKFLFLKLNEMQSFPFCPPELSAKSWNITFQSFVCGSSLKAMLHVSSNMQANCS